MSIQRARFSCGETLKDVCTFAQVSTVRVGRARRTLDLRNNSFSGAVPEGLARAGRLESLFLSGNELTGPIPSSIGDGLTKLEYLGNMLRHTKLFRSFFCGCRFVNRSGSSQDVRSVCWRSADTCIELISKDVCVSPRMRPRAPPTTGLSTNHLTGVVPASVGSLQRLKSLR